MNINHLVISGNLTRPVELRPVGADKCVAQFTIANNSKFKKADGEQMEEVTFLQCSAWGRQAEVAAQYLSQGSQVIVEGQLRTDKWTSKEGEKREKIVLRVERVHLVGSKGERPADDGEVAPVVAAGPRRAAAVVQGASGGTEDPPFAICRHLGA